MFNANERNPRRESGTCRNAAVGQRTYRSKDWKTIMQHFQLEAHNFNSDNVMSFLNNLIIPFMDDSLPSKTVLTLVPKILFFVKDFFSYHNLNIIPPEFMKKICEILRHYTDRQLQYSKLTGQQEKNVVADQIYFLIKYQLGDQHNYDLLCLDIFVRLQSIANGNNEIFLILFKKIFTKPARISPLKLDDLVYLKYVAIFNRWYEILDQYYNEDDRRNLIEMANNFIRPKSNDRLMKDFNLLIGTPPTPQYFMESMTFADIFSQIKTREKELDSPLIRNVEDLNIGCSTGANIKQEARIRTFKTEQPVDVSEIVDLTDDIEEVVIPDLPRFKWMDKLETRVDELSKRKKAEDKSIDPNRETIEILSDDEGPVEQLATDNGSVDSGCMTSDPEDMLQRANANALTVSGPSSASSSVVHIASIAEVSGESLEPEVVSIELLKISEKNYTLPFVNRNAESDQDTDNPVEDDEPEFTFRKADLRTYRKKDKECPVLVSGSNAIGRTQSEESSTSSVNDFGEKKSSSAVASPTPKILFSSTAQIPLRQVSNSSAESNLDESRKSINGTSSLSEPKKIFSSNQSLYKIRDTAASAEITKNIGILIRKDYIISSSTHTTPFSVPIESSQAYESDAGFYSSIDNSITNLTVPTISNSPKKCLTICDKQAQTPERKASNPEIKVPSPGLLKSPTHATNVKSQTPEKILSPVAKVATPEIKATTPEIKATTPEITVSAASEIKTVRASTPETKEIKPAPEIVEIEPTTEIIEIEPTNKIIEIEPATEVIEIEPSTEIIEIEPTTEIIEIEPATKIIEIEPTNEIKEIEPTTEIVCSVKVTLDEKIDDNIEIEDEVKQVPEVIESSELSSKALSVEIEEEIKETVRVVEEEKIFDPEPEIVAPTIARQKPVEITFDPLKVIKVNDLSPPIRAPTRPESYSTHTDEEGETTLPFKKRRKMSIYCESIRCKSEDEVVEVRNYQQQRAQMIPVSIQNRSSIQNNPINSNNSNNPSASFNIPNLLRDNTSVNISYPATPMLSIASIAHLLPNNSGQVSNDQNGLLFNSQINMHGQGMDSNMMQNSQQNAITSNMNFEYLQALSNSPFNRIQNVQPTILLNFQQSQQQSQENNYQHMQQNAPINFPQNSFNYASSLDWINFRNYQMSQEHMDNYMQNIQFKSTMPNPYHSMRQQQHTFMQIPTTSGGYMEQNNAEMFPSNFSGNQAAHSGAESEGNEERNKKNDKDSSSETCRVTRSSQRKESKQSKRKRSNSVTRLDAAELMTVVREENVEKYLSSNSSRNSTKNVKSVKEAPHVNNVKSVKAVKEAPKVKKVPAVISKVLAPIKSAIKIAVKNNSTKTVTFSDPIEEYLPIHRKLIVLMERLTDAEIDRFVNRRNGKNATNQLRLKQSVAKPGPVVPVLTSGQKIRARRPTIFAEYRPPSPDVEEIDASPSTSSAHELLTPRVSTPIPEPIPILIPTHELPSVVAPETISAPDNFEQEQSQNATDLLNIEPVKRKLKIMDSKLEVTPEMLTTYQVNLSYFNSSEERIGENFELKQPEIFDTSVEIKEADVSMVSILDDSINYEPCANMDEESNILKKRAEPATSHEKIRECFVRTSIHISDNLSNEADYRCYESLSNVESSNEVEEILVEKKVVDTKEVVPVELVETQNDDLENSEPMPVPNEREQFSESPAEMVEHQKSLEQEQELPKEVNEIEHAVKTSSVEEPIAQEQETNDLSQTETQGDEIVVKEVVAKTPENKHRKRNRRLTIHSSAPLENAPIIQSPQSKRKKRDIYDFEESSISSSDSKKKSSTSSRPAEIRKKSLSVTDVSSKSKPLRPLIKMTDLRELNPSFQPCSNGELQIVRRKSVYDPPSTSNSNSLYKKSLKILSSTRSKVLSIFTPTPNLEVSFPKKHQTIDKATEDKDSRPLSSRLPPRRSSMHPTALVEKKISGSRRKSFNFTETKSDRSAIVPNKKNTQVSRSEPKEKPKIEVSNISSKTAVIVEPRRSRLIEDKSFLQDTEPAPRPRIRVRRASLFPDKYGEKSPVQDIPDSNLKQLSASRFLGIAHSFEAVKSDAKKIPQRRKTIHYDNPKKEMTAHDSVEQISKVSVSNELHNKRSSRMSVSSRTHQKEQLSSQNTNENASKRIRTRRNTDGSFSSSPYRSESPTICFKNDNKRKKKIHTTGDDDVAMKTDSQEYNKIFLKRELRICLNKCSPEEHSPTTSTSESLPETLQEIPETSSEIIQPPDNLPDSELLPETPLDTEIVQPAEEQASSDVDSDDLPLQSQLENSEEHPKSPSKEQEISEIEDSLCSKTTDAEKAESKLSIPLNLLDMDKIVLPFDKNNPGPAFVQSDQETYEPVIHCSLFNGFVRSEQEPPDLLPITTNLKATLPHPDNEWPEYELTVQTEDICKTPPREQTDSSRFPYSPISPPTPPRIKIIDNVIVQQASPAINHNVQESIQESQAAFEAYGETNGLPDQDSGNLEEFMKTIHFGSGAAEQLDIVEGTRIMTGNFPVAPPEVTDTSKITHYLDQLGGVTSNHYDHVYEKPVNEDKSAPFPEFRINGIQPMEEDSDGTHLEDELEESVNEEISSFTNRTVELHYPKQRCADKHLKIEAYQAKVAENKHSEEEDENMDEYDEDISLSSTPISDQNSYSKNLGRESPKINQQEDLNDMHKDLSGDAGSSGKDSAEGEKELDENGVDVKIWKDNYPPDQETMDNNEKVKILADIVNDEIEEQEVSMEVEVVYDDEMYYENPDDIGVEFEESYVAGLDKSEEYQDNDTANLQEETVPTQFEIRQVIKTPIAIQPPPVLNSTYTKKKVREKAVPVKKSPKKKEKPPRAEPRRVPKTTNKRKTKPPQQLLSNTKAMDVLNQQRQLAEQQRAAELRKLENIKIAKLRQEEQQRARSNIVTPNNRDGKLVKSCLKKIGASKPNKIVMFPSDLPENIQRQQMIVKPSSYYTQPSQDR